VRALAKLYITGLPKLSMATIGRRESEKAVEYSTDSSEQPNEVAVSPQSHCSLVAAARRLKWRSALSSFERFWCKLRHWLWYLIEDLFEVGKLAWSQTRWYFVGKGGSTVHGTKFEPYVTDASNYRHIFMLYTLVLSVC